jgi:hypothetical protein
MNGLVTLQAKLVPFAFLVLLDELCPLWPLCRDPVQKCCRQ